MRLLLLGVFSCVCLMLARLLKVTTRFFCRTLRTWDISAGVCERLLEGHQMWITSVLPLREGIVGSTSRDGCARSENIYQLAYRKRVIMAAMPACLWSGSEISSLRTTNAGAYAFGTWTSVSATASSRLIDSPPTPSSSCRTATS